MFQYNFTYLIYLAASIKDIDLGTIRLRGERRIGWNN